MKTINKWIFHNFFINFINYRTIETNFEDENTVTSENPDLQLETPKPNEKKSGNNLFTLRNYTSLYLKPNNYNDWDITFMVLSI